MTVYLCDLLRTPNESGDICIMTLRGLQKGMQCIRYLVFCYCQYLFYRLHLTHETKVNANTRHFSSSKVKHVS
jgi:hypothetical protein